MQYQDIPDSTMGVTTEVGLHGESSQTGRVRFFLCIILNRALLTLACSWSYISLFFGLLFIWRLRRPLIGRDRSLKLTGCHNSSRVSKFFSLSYSNAMKTKRKLFFTYYLSDFALIRYSDDSVNFLLYVPNKICCFPLRRCGLSPSSKVAIVDCSNDKNSIFVKTTNSTLTNPYATI